jgi:selenocysteine lyase/cysteine desulfurase
MQNVEQHIIENSRYLIDALTQSSDKIQLISPQTANRYAGIITFRHQHIASTALFHYLSERGIVCALRGGGIRFSPHFYTQRDKLEYAIKQVIACPF